MNNYFRIYPMTTSLELDTAFMAKDLSQKECLKHIRSEEDWILYIWKQCLGWEDDISLERKNKYDV